VAEAAIIEALVQVARKRQLLGRGASRRLGVYVRQRGIADLAGLRSWLAAADGIDPEVAAKLAGLLAPDGMPPFGSWRPLAHLADGGMGRVWLAAGVDGTLAVVKTLKQGQGDDGSGADERVRRFAREADITRDLKHPNLVRCLDGGALADGTLYLVLEYVDHGDLRDLVAARGQLSEGLSLAIMHQIVDALVEAHRLRLVHRDIKPSNIFVAHDGRARLADFGVARSTEANRTLLTLDGAMVGSPLYMSPEQIRSDPALDIRTDLYAVGGVLCYCLTGKPPYEGKLPDVLRQHCEAPPPDVRTLHPGISPGTAAIVAACMAKSPSQRPADPAALRALIAAALAERGVSVRDVIDDETRNRPCADGESADAPAAGAALLTQGFAVFAPAAAAVGATSGLADRGAATVFANLSGRDPGDTHPEAADAQRTAMMATITADLLKAEGSGTRSGTDTGTARGEGSATAGVEVESRRERLAGALDEALATDWIALLPVAAGDPTAVLLFARLRLVLGKLREPPVDLCLRNYPVPAHKDALQRISRQHLVLRYDRLARACLVEDLGGANGSRLEGQALNKGAPRTLEPGQTQTLVVAGTVSLELRCRAARSRRKVLIENQPPEVDPVCGLDADHAVDALIITRPENRSELAYAMVLRRLTIGGPGADLALTGARSLAAVAIARYAGRWIWRATGDEAWRPLAAGQQLDCGGRALVARMGSHELF